MLEKSPKKPRVSKLSSNNEVKLNGKVDGILKIVDGCTENLSTEVPVDLLKNKKCKTDTNIKDQSNRRTKN